MAPHTNRIEQLYGEKEGKPITLAETSAPFRYHQVRPGLGFAVDRATEILAGYATSSSRRL